MDFMKVFDQTVREIKREVNLKVLKIPEIEQKSLTGFEYVEPNGKDVGINVRKKAEKIVGLLNDKDKIQEARNKAAATREKYVGLSSSGITYKSSSGSFNSGGFQSSNRYGGFSGRYDSDNYRDKHEDNFGEDNFDKFVPKSRQGASTERKTARYSSKEQDTSSGPSNSSSQINSSEYSAVSHQAASAPSNSQIGDDDDDDDFDPRGTTKSKPAAVTGSSQPLDLFGDSLIGDLLDAPTSIPVQSKATNNNSSDVDLFADADFVSAAPKAEVGGKPQTQV